MNEPLSTSPSRSEPEPAAGPPLEHGHFRIRSLVAKGGMGEVYVAWDSKLDREVALKIIRGKSRLDPFAKDRFLREARALSQLEHPAICRIYDYVEGDETDYIVLELIRGRNLLEALKAELDYRVKLRIAQELAEALVAAHGKGIIHRDLKPENVMLTAENRVRVLDFGLAKTVRGDEPTETVVMTRRRQDRVPRMATGTTVSPGTTTRLGDIVGTPAYMSPEQANGDRATPASDMYSLGLVLQHLFTGKSAYESGLKLEELLDRAGRGKTLPCTGLDPDLAALIDRLKSFAPGARPSALDTVERLRFVEEKPKRRRRRLLAATAAAAVLAFGIVMSVQTYQISKERSRAAMERDRANREAEVSQEVSNFLVDLFEVSDPGRAQGNTVTARELLDQGAARLADLQLQDPAIQVRMMATIGRIYQRLGLYDESADLLERALHRGEDVSVEGEVLASLAHELGSLYWRTGDYDRAERELGRAVSSREEILGGDDPELADSLVILAGVYFARGQYGRAQSLCERALEIWEETGDPRSIKALSNLAVLHYEQGRFAAAEPLYRRLLESQRAQLGPAHPELAMSSMNFGLVLLERAKLSEAEVFLQRATEIYERIYPSEHQNTALAYTNLASLYVEQGRLDEAEALAERARATFSASVGEEHALAAWNLAQLAGIHRLRGETAAAAQEAEAALELLERLVGPEHPFVADALQQLSLVREQQGHPDLAEQAMMRALDIRRAAYGSDHPTIARTLHHLARFQGARGRPGEAVASEQGALAIFEKTLRPDHPATVESRRSLTDLRRELGVQAPRAAGAVAD